MVTLNLPQRVLAWIAASAILIVLAFPDVSTVYVGWIDGKPIRLFELHNGHRIVTDIERGPKKVNAIFDRELLAAVGREQVNDWAENSQKESIINWWPSVGYTFLIAVIAMFGLYALKTRITLSRSL
jgi:hypothetical protein